MNQDLTKRMAFIAPLLCAMICAALAPCSSATVREIGERDNGGVVLVRRGDIIRLRLPARLSTGYGWTPGDTRKARLLGEPATETAGTKITGGLDYQIFTFRIMESGEGEIALVYAKPWEKGTRPLKSFSVRLSAR